MSNGRRDARAPARFERMEPQRVVVGGGSLLYVEGSLFTAGISRLEVVLAGKADPAVLYLDSDNRRRFWAAVPLDATVAPGTHEVRLRGAGPDVGESIEVGIATNHTVAYDAPPGSEPLVAICLATHNPPPDLLERQLESIRAQSHERFVCLISDDASEPHAWERVLRAVEGDSRFVSRRSEERLGFYRNFEHCLTLVPADASYVALSDQDDRWHQDKLATLVEELERGDALLAFSDLNVVSADGRTIAASYWLDRTNNFTELGTLLLSNTVTGAASLFRRELLDDVLPFPPDVGKPFHDHWIACVALALGRIAYVDRPLYDYVQHPENVLGHPAQSDDLRGGLLHAIGRLAANPRRRLASTARNAGDTYRRDVVRLELFARTLELRLGDRIVRSQAGDVHRAAHVGTSLRSLAWLLGRSARDVRGRSATLGVENQLVKGIVWRRWHALRARARSI